MNDQRIDLNRAAHLKSLEVLAKGASLTLAGRISGRVIALANQVLVARLLGPASYGLFALAWGGLRLSQVIAPLGLEKAVIRFGGRHFPKDPIALRGTVRQTIVLSILTGGVLGIAVFVAAPTLADQVFKEEGLTPVLRGLAPAFALLSGLIVAAAATTISQDMRYSIRSLELLQPAAQLALLVGFLALGWQLLGAVAAVVISMALALALVLYDLRRVFPGLSVRGDATGTPVRELLAYSVPVALASLLSTLLVWTDRFMVGFFLSVQELGVYQAAAQSSILFGIILSGFNSIFMPVIVSYERQKQREGLKELYRVSTKWGLYLSLPIFLVMVVFSRELVQVVFGKGYEGAAVPMVILASGQLINVATGAVGILHTMTDYPKRWAVISGCMLILNLGLGWALIPRIGLIGAALANAIAVSALFLIGLLSLRISMGLWPYDLRYLKGLAAGAAALLAVLGIRAIPISDPFVRLAVAGLSSAGVFALILIVLGIDAEDRYLLSTFWGRRRRGRE